MQIIKVKAFANDKLNGTQNIELVLHRVENIVEKGENAGFHGLFLRPFFQGIKSCLTKV